VQEGRNNETVNISPAPLLPRSSAWTKLLKYFRSAELEPRLKRFVWDRVSFRLNLSSSNNLNYSFPQNSLNFPIRYRSQQNVIIARFLPLVRNNLRNFKGYGDCEQLVRFSGILSMVGFLWVLIIPTQLNSLNIRKTLYNFRFSSHCQCPLRRMYFFKVSIKIITKY
jgi:hypothetical protein